ncbi:MAG: O-antigen polymerase [Sphingomicrobium sp.]
MSAGRIQSQARPPTATARADAPTVPRVFQFVLIAYVLLTGELIHGAQAALFGLQGGGDAVFTAAVLLAIAIDIARIAPLILYSRHPLGILHPLILTTVLWPLMIAMPRVIDELGGLGGLLLGQSVSPPFFAGLGWLPGPEIWRAVAWTNLCQLVALLSIYTGYAFVHDRLVAVAESPRRGVHREFDGKRLRMLAIVLIGISVAVLLVLISLRGGLAVHLADMARGRFRSLAGLGPLVAAVDLGLVALVVWTAARPGDVRRPIFLSLMVIVACAQFISNGSRSAALTGFIMVGVTWALRTRKIPWRLALIMAPLIFLSLGALNVIRTSGFVGETASEAIQGTDSGQVLERVQDEIDLRRSLDSAVPVIWEGHEVMNGPLWGSTYAAAIFAFVPREIWPAKPRGPGSLYAQNFLGEVREGTAVPVNPAAEEHWNFGILGVVLISVLYGALIRHAHNFYIRRPENPFSVAGFVLFVTTFHPSTDDLVLFQQQVMLLLLVWGLALLVASRTRTSGVNPSVSRLGPATGRPHALG